jgi:hypothetical protein
LDGSCDGTAIVAIVVKGITIIGILYYSPLTLIYSSFPLLWNIPSNYFIFLEEKQHDVDLIKKKEKKTKTFKLDISY